MAKMQCSRYIMHNSYSRENRLCKETHKRVIGMRKEFALVAEFQLSGAILIETHKMNDKRTGGMCSYDERFTDDSKTDSKKGIYRSC